MSMYPHELDRFDSEPSANHSLIRYSHIPQRESSNSSTAPIGTCVFLLCFVVSFNYLDKPVFKSNFNKTENCSS